MMGNTRTSPVCENGNGTDFSDPLMKVTDSEILVVLHDYPSPDISQPIFRMGEKLRVMSEEGCWWRVKSVITGRENYIPNNHVAKVYHGWLFEGVVRQKAEELLHLPGNRIGSFMIRESTREKGVYSLSVRHRSITHYRIFRLPNNWYYISPRLTFQCLEDLVNHYSDSADGLCCVLTAPCLALAASNLNLTSQAPPVVMRRNFDWENVQSSELLNQGSQCFPENKDSVISFGVRNSIASYLSLAGFQETREKSFRKKKRKSFYAFPDRHQSRMATEEDNYE
ncbi:src-like-adapter [Megalops cyprinoides]|uniref:src-like-adapter n=1 Tax=Megalops cyprinoides TaxID=118141 RepID=UPI0018656817|nr:src-like-adapter [Megalops cyprinoides]